MPSASIQQWNAGRGEQLDEIEAAHATQQINHAYAMLLSSQFQGFCRDLHSECIDCLTGAVTPVGFRNTLRDEFLFSRKLDQGNPNPGNIGSDFARLGVEFWRLVYEEHGWNNTRREHLDAMVRWRNAIAHQDFDPARLGGMTTLHLSNVKAWRKACNGLANSFDRVMHAYLARITGSNPW